MVEFITALSCFNFPLLRRRNYFITWNNNKFFTREIIMKRNFIVCSALTTVMLVLPAAQANAGLFDRLKERFRFIVKEEPAAQPQPVVQPQPQPQPVVQPLPQGIDVDNYSDQAAILTTTLMKLAPLMKGKSQTGLLSKDLKLNLSSFGLDMGSQGIKVTDGLEIGLGGISIEPIGVTLTAYMDDMRIIQATEYTADIYAVGSIDMTIGYDLVKQRVVVNMDSADYGPTVYNGGRLEGTTIEYGDVGVSISTKQFLMPWEEQFSVAGTIYVNGMAIPIEEMKNLIELMMKG